MPHDRRFRFGIQLAQPLEGRTWADTARHVEEVGYSTLFLPDHFGDQLAPVPAMMAAADATTTLNVGTLVFDNDYKHPLILAKEIATIDRLVGGRVEFGLGAGWMRADYEQAGLPYDAPKVRVDRFMEGVQIIKGLWSDEPVSFDGEHYTITGHNGLPKPATPGGPPVIIGAGGKRMLRFAGEHADIVGISATIASGEIDAATGRDAAVDRFGEKLGWVKDGAGDRFDDIELNIQVAVTSITDDAMGFAGILAPMFGVSPEMVLDTPATAIGTVDEICARFEQRREQWGLSYVVFMADAFESALPIVERLTGR